MTELVVLTTLNQATAILFGIFSVSRSRLDHLTCTLSNIPYRRFVNLIDSTLRIILRILSHNLLPLQTFDTCSIIINRRRIWRHNIRIDSGSQRNTATCSTAPRRAEPLLVLSLLCNVRKLTELDMAHDRARLLDLKLLALLSQLRTTLSIQSLHSWDKWIVSRYTTNL